METYTDSDGNTWRYFPLDGKTKEEMEQLLERGTEHDQSRFRAEFAESIRTYERQTGERFPDPPRSDYITD